jgi:SAM-dependent methyltransferase
MVETSLLPAVPNAYDDVARGYDLLTADYAYEPWVAAIERLALACGLRGRRLLDVACGTGSSFLPFVARGYTVSACDGSAAMAAIAAAKAPLDVDVSVADMRELPVYGSFDLVTCLDDAINHLDQPEDVVRTFAGVRANLDPGGLLVFDVNTLISYRDVPVAVVEDGALTIIWRGDLTQLEVPGGCTRVCMELLERYDGDLWRRSTAEWPHRHYPVDQICELLDAAGLTLVAIRGQRTGGVLDSDHDETTHGKVLFVARREAT